MIALWLYLVGLVQSTTHYKSKCHAENIQMPVAYLLCIAFWPIVLTAYILVVVLCGPNDHSLTRNECIFRVGLFCLGLMLLMAFTLGHVTAAIFAAILGSLYFLGVYLVCSN